MKQRKLIFHFTQSQVNILSIEIRKKKGPELNNSVEEKHVQTNIKFVIGKYHLSKLIKDSL